jgi:ABC-type transport system involved in cytochrome c biogenesis permease subunit
MAVSFLQGVTHACFGLSYLCAFALELGRLFWPGKGWRPASLLFGIAGFIAHSFYIYVHQPSPATPYGSLVLLAWVLAVFYLSGTINHAKQAWAIFVLPVVIGLVGMSFALLHSDESGAAADALGWASGDRFWGAIHGLLILAAAVGVSVGFLASVMYLIQARRLRNKAISGRGVPLLSLERLETMNRWAVNATVPFLTVGLLVGTLLVKQNTEGGESWLSVKIISTTGLWVVFLVLLYMRYARHVAPRLLAMLSIVAFGLMLVALGTSHPFFEGGIK